MRQQRLYHQRPRIRCQQDDRLEMPTCEDNEYWSGIYGCCMSTYTGTRRYWYPLVACYKPAVAHLFAPSAHLDWLDEKQYNSSFIWQCRKRLIRLLAKVFGAKIHCVRWPGSCMLLIHGGVIIKSVNRFSAFLCCTVRFWFVCPRDESWLIEC